MNNIITTNNHNAQLAELPFYNITNIELFDTLESPETRIRSFLKNNNFGKFIDSAASGLYSQSCKYYSIEQMNQNLKNSSYISSSLLHLNIRSLNKHLGALFTLVNSIDFDFDFVALSEIGRVNIESRAATIETQFDHQFKYEKPTLSKGGVGLIARKDLDLQVREDLKIRKPTDNKCKLEIESIWYEAVYPDQKKSIIIGVIYRHPGSNVDGLNHFTSEMQRITSIISEEKKESILCGDLNVDGLKIENEHEKEFFNTILGENFIPTITLPTRITEETISLIDHIIINGTENTKLGKSITSGNIFNDISDHLPVFIIINSEKPTPLSKRPFIRTYGAQNIQSFACKLQNANWEEFYSVDDDEKALDIFTNIYKVAFNESFPLKRLSRKRAKDKKWVTLGIKISSNTKDKLYRKYLKKPTPQNKVLYSRYKNVYTTCCRQAEENFYKNLIDAEKQNVRKLWQIFGPVINPKRLKRKEKVAKLLVANNYLNENKDIADAFNTYFTSIGESLAAKIHETKDFKDYLTEPNQRSFYLHPVTVNEVRVELIKLKESKGPGHDSISPKLLKRCSHIFADPLAHIINLSYSRGHVPDTLKIAKIIPIYKKNEVYLPDNYRPISILSAIHKIVEKLTHKRLYKFLVKYNILFRYQFGFRNSYSTVMALIEIVDRIRITADAGKAIAGLYIDLSKAFDTVDHAKLLYKMEHYGVRGLPLTWFKSYLTNRQQYTWVNGEASGLKTVKCGVPQGSVLGPLLFLLYVNDIGKCVDKYAEIRLFADDTNVFITERNPLELKRKAEITLNNLLTWFSANKLTANISKTCFSIFTPKNIMIPNLLNSLKFGNSKISRVESAKYLGITLDENLNFKDHIEILSNSLTKIISSFKIIKHQVSKKSKYKLFNAYINSKIMYGIEVYGHTGMTVLKRIQTQQNKALKILFDKDFRTKTEKLHSDLQLLTVKDTQHLSIAKFVHKQVHNKLPDIFNNLFTPAQNIHEHDTRFQNIHINQQSTERGKKSMVHYGAVIWNNLPSYTRKINELKTFSKEVKKSYIAKYKKN